jgi:hypothetical protein
MRGVARRHMFGAVMAGAKRAAVVAIGLLAVVASGAYASTIYYRCGGNICSIRPDGSGKQQLTTDGGYSTPSISRDGSKLAFVHSNTASSATRPGRTPSTSVSTRRC